MRRLLAILVIASLLLGCRQESPKLQPETFDPGAYARAFEPLPSQIPFPLFLSYTELEKLMNSALPVVLLNDTDYDKGKIKNAKVRLLRTGPVELRNSGSRLHLKVPLKADVRPQISKTVLGKEMTVAPKIKAAFFLNLSTTVEIDSNYRIISDLKVENIDWIDDPTVRVVFWDVPITEMVDSIIGDKTQIIEQALNKLVRKGVDLRRPVEKVWTDLQKPLRINKHVEQVYLINRPFKLELSGIHLSDAGIIANLELFTFVHTGLVSDTGLVTHTLLPHLTRVDSMARDFEINFFVRVPMEKASAILQNEFRDKPIEVGGRSLLIEDIYIQNSPDRVLVNAQIKKPTQAYLRIESNIEFIPADTAIKATDFNFLLLEGNAFVTAVEAVLHTTVLDVIGDRLVLSLGSLMHQIGPLVEGAVEKGQIGESISIKLEEVMMEPTQILLRPEALWINVKGTGKVELEILHLKSRKNRNQAYTN